jgi:hypothetical protein
LSTQADHIPTTLSGVKQECQGKTRRGTNRQFGLKKGDVGQALGLEAFLTGGKQRYLACPILFEIVNLGYQGHFETAMMALTREFAASVLVRDGAFRGLMEMDFSTPKDADRFGPEFLQREIRKYISGAGLNWPLPRALQYLTAQPAPRAKAQDQMIQRWRLLPQCNCRVGQYLGGAPRLAQERRT